MTGSAVDDDSDPRDRARVGSVLHDKWTLERILGSGGMGAVYAGRHRNGARGAVKILHPELARRPDVRERFLREGYAANRVEHRGAVQVLDDDIIKEGPDEGTAYLVMEILEGESLEERIERGPPLTEIELLQILNDVLEVLEAAHDHGVVHRDLKPANLFLNKDPSGHGVKVLDFGLARLAEARSTTSAGLALGTPSFMAPEQANGRSTEIDARTDIFAIGATAFMILSNRGVHEADGVIELVARMGTIPAPKLCEVAPHVSELVGRIVDRALEFKREDRYASAGAMRADVVSVLSSRQSLRNGGTLTAPSLQSRRSNGWLVLALLVAAGVALLLLVPRARERSGVDNALGQIVGAGSRAAASGAQITPIASAEASAAPMASALASGGAFDAASAALLPDLPGDAAADLDAGGDASADDDDDDDDVDASDLAAIAAHDAGHATTAHPVAKARPRSAPGVKHGKPRKHKRPRRR